MSEVLDKSFTMSAVKIRMIEYKAESNKAFALGDEEKGENLWAKWNAMNRMYDELEAGIYDVK